MPTVKRPPAVKRGKCAINPLPWIIGTDLSWNLTEGVLRTALHELGGIGFSALQADVPVGMSVERYASLLDSFGFHPAPGYFGGRLDDPANRSALLESARAAAGTNAALGLSEMFIASDIAPERIAHPAIGAHAQAERLARITDAAVAVAETMAAEGVTAALHPHVGTWIETEEEIRAVLEGSQGTALAFGPDTGHLYWAGVDLGGVLYDFSDRIVAIHLKDVDEAARDAAMSSGADYVDATMVRHVWTEPGRGGIDFDRAIASLPEDFDGWAVIEVDVPNLPDRIQSTQASFDWLMSNRWVA